MMIFFFHFSFVFVCTCKATGSLITISVGWCEWAVSFSFCCLAFLFLFFRIAHSFDHKCCKSLSHSMCMCDCYCCCGCCFFITILFICSVNFISLKRTFVWIPTSNSAHINADNKHLLAERCGRRSRFWTLEWNQKKWNRFFLSLSLGDKLSSRTKSTNIYTYWSILRVLIEAILKNPKWICR